MKIKDGKITITSKIAYIAGFFDGEGCIRIKQASQKGNSYYVIAHITNTNHSILTEIEYLFGGKVRKQERGVNKTVYNWSLSSSEAVDFIKTLSPFLKEKLEQAKTAIYFHEHKQDMSLKTKVLYYKQIMALKK